MGKLIAIGGVSRAGKTELAAYLSKHLTNVSVLHQDQFVKTQNEIPEIQDRVDWEHPDSIDWAKWQSAVNKSTSAFEFTILDGLFALYDPVIESQTDLKIYLSLDKDRFVKLKHEDQRWGDEPDWFIEHIWNSHFQYGCPKDGASLIRIHNVSQDHRLELLREIQIL